MAETIKKRLGRTLHAIQLLSHYQLVPLAPGTTGLLKGSEEEAGYIAQRDTFFKEIIRTIFRLDKTSNTYHVGNHPFSIHSPSGNINVPGGIVNKVCLATFQHNTTVIIYGPSGRILQQIPLAGNPALN